MKQKLVTIEFDCHHSARSGTTSEHLEKYLQDGWAIDSMTAITSGDGFWASLAVLLVK